MAHAKRCVETERRNNMTQYCRYCSFMVCGDANYCSVRETTYSDSYIKNPNRCKDFELNPVDALYENPDGYRPIKQKQEDGEQIEIL